MTVDRYRRWSAQAWRHASSRPPPDRSASARRGPPLQRRSPRSDRMFAPFAHFGSRGSSCVKSRSLAKIGRVIERKRHGRKLLIASIGVAAVSYVACGGSTTDNGRRRGQLGRRVDAGTGGNGNTGGRRDRQHRWQRHSNTGGRCGRQPHGYPASTPAPAERPRTGVPVASGNIQDAAAEKAVFGFDVSRRQPDCSPTARRQGRHQVAS